VPAPVPVGFYRAYVEHQPPLDLTSVEDPAQPVVLPLGRPHVDCFGCEAFLPDARPAPRPMAESRDLARRLMLDAFDAVEAGHREKLTRLAHYIKHTASGAYRGMDTAQKVSIGVGIGATVAVTIASAAVTGGLSVPVLLGVGAGTYAVRTLIEKIGGDLARENRNWLARYDPATKAGEKEHGNMLACEAGDAIRRAVDHYLITKEILEKELKPHLEAEYATCADALNHTKAVARFIHHADKTRNYLLACLDMCLFYLDEYRKLAGYWKAYQEQVDEAFIEWFERHKAAIQGSCAAGGKSQVCYAPTGHGDDRPMRPHPKDGKTTSAPSDKPEAGEAVDIEALAAALKEARDDKLVAAMTRSADGPAATYNYSSDRPEYTRTVSLRMEALVNDVWMEVDRPGYLARAARRVAHAVSRRTTPELIADLMSQTVSIGSIFTPFINDAPISETLQMVIKGAITAKATLATHIGGGILRSKGALPVTNDLLGSEVIRAAAERDVKASAVTIQWLTRSVFTHFANGVEALRELEGTELRLQTCQDAWILACKQAEAIHELNKVNKYLLCTVALVDRLCAVASSWAEKEREIWVTMEQDVSNWVQAVAVHQECRVLKQRCYGV
jgi:hypothetical protein